MENYETIENYSCEENLNLEKLVNDYSNYICTIIKNMSNNIFRTEDLEEIVSDVLFVVWKNKSKIKPELPLKPYISGITKNIVKNRLRKKKNIFVMHIDDENNNLEIEEQRNIEETIELNEQINAIKEVLEKNGEENVIIFKMFYYESMKIKDISEKLGISENNVATKLHRVRKKLKKELENRGFYYGK